MSYHQFGVTLTDGQKEKFFHAVHSKTPTTIRLGHDQLSGHDILLLTKTQVNKIAKARSSGAGVDITLSKAQLAGQRGGSLFSSLLPLFGKMLPAVTSVASKVLPGLPSGVLQSVGSFGMDKILGNGLQNRPAAYGYGLQNRPAASRGSGCCYQVEHGRLPELAQHGHLLTKKQQTDVVHAANNGTHVIIKPTKAQSGGFIGSLLAGIGIPLLIKAITGKGMRNRPSHSGEGFTKAGKKKIQGNGLILGSNSPFKNIPLLGAIL